jgi:hypothetical protein
MYTSRGSYGALQKRYQSAAQNLHFTGPHITMITMGIPFVVVFEVEVVEPY